MFESTDEARGYLAGIIDGEGSVTMRPQTKRGMHSFTRDLRITNTESSIIEAAKAALDLLGIEYKVYTRTDRAGRSDVFGTKPLHDIVVMKKESLDRIRNVVNLRCDYKRDQLAAMAGTYKRKNRPPQAELETHLAAGLSDAKIAAIYGVTPGAVWFWRQRYGLAAARHRRAAV